MCGREPPFILIFVSELQQVHRSQASLVLQILGLLLRVLLLLLLLLLIGSLSQRKGGTTHPGHLSFKAA